MAIFNVHAGHNRIVPGARGHLDEVQEDRIVKNKLIQLLRAAGHIVYDCTDDVGRTQNANLHNIVTKCNQHRVDLDISIHLNSYNGQAHGVEVLNYDTRTDSIANRIASKIASTLGIKNRGLKYRPELYVLKNTKSKAILIECCFVDSQEDYDAWGGNICAGAIADALIDYYGSSSNRSTNGNKSIREIAEEVKNGNWGNGRERKRRLQAAGYDYAAVQREVNRISK